MKRILRLAAVALVLAFPWLPGVTSSMVVNANLAGEYALVAISLVILTGWVGQISLGQGSFVGIGAFATGLLARELNIPFPVNLPIVAAITALVAAALGIVALRVRGLYLAVATLIFAWMADSYLFGSAWLVGAGGASSITNRPIGSPDTFTYFDLSDKRVFYLVIVAAVSASLYIAVNLRDSKTGRAFFAVRGSEVAAVSLGIDVSRYKLMAFAISGAFAGVSGNLLMTDLRTATPTAFEFVDSLFYLSVAVVGGIASLPGAVAASVLFAGLDILFFRYPWLEEVRDILPVVLLLAVLLGYPGGLGALGSSLRRIVTPRSLSSEVSKKPRVGATGDGGTGSTRFAGSPGTSHDPSSNLERQDREIVLDATNITVRFGGLVAVDKVGLQVRTNEIVGLIGPNGAGKTTFFNAISGLNQPSSGTITLFGKDATRMPVHARARLGVGRTFQLIQLFPQLSVFDNLLVATHMHNPTGLVAHLLLTDKAVTAEAAARERVSEMVELLGLQDVADRRVADLPFGILRKVEIARALVTGSPFLMLDEPASGLDNNETDQLAELLNRLRDELGISILLIEHDVKLVTSISDHIYVIDRGQPLAEGRPSEIQNDPDVIAAYLGQPHQPGELAASA